MNTVNALEKTMLERSPVKKTLHKRVFVGLLLNVFQKQLQSQNFK